MASDYKLLHLDGDGSQTIYHGFTMYHPFGPHDDRPWTDRLVVVWVEGNQDLWLTNGSDDAIDQLRLYYIATMDTTDFLIEVWQFVESKAGLTSG